MLRQQFNPTSNSNCFDYVFLHQNPFIRLERSCKSTMMVNKTYHSHHQRVLVVALAVASLLRLISSIGLTHALFCQFSLPPRALTTTLAAKSTSPSSTKTLLTVTVQDENIYDDFIDDSRRSLLRKAAIAVTAVILPSISSVAAVAEQEPEYRQGIKVNAFNGLIFNYRGSDFNGLTSSDVGDEPSVSYAEFNQRLAAGEVEYVEFLAPDGDKAYVTFKAKDGYGNNMVRQVRTPIRIGEGYPIEKHDGYSSPLFCVRAVKNAGVPYKFVVPSLSKYSSTTSSI
jgi:hypothetical protein